MSNPHQKRFSWFKTARKNLFVLLKYGTLKPSRIRLPGCRHWLQVDPNERYARGILVSDSARGKVTRAVRTWRCFNEHLKPEVAVDVGANYGECLLGTTYRNDARLFGCEANPRVFDYLDRSRQDHPNAPQIKLHNFIISDRDEPARTLYVDPDYSGTASAVAALHSAEGTVRHEVPVTSLDRLLPRDALAGKRLLFKMDIEGYECRAMQGFLQSIAAATAAIGIIEFDSHYLEQAGDKPEEFLAFLSQQFQILHPADAGFGQWKCTRGFDLLPRKSKEPGRIHTDLVLVKPAANWKQALPQRITVVD